MSGAEPDADLIEWDYGPFEGLTAEQILELKPGWELWRDGVDAGEDLGHVTARQFGHPHPGTINTLRLPVVLGWNVP